MLLYFILISYASLMFPSSISKSPYIAETHQIVSTYILFIKLYRKCACDISSLSLIDWCFARDTASILFPICIDRHRMATVCMQDKQSWPCKRMDAQYLETCKTKLNTKASTKVKCEKKWIQRGKMKSKYYKYMKKKTRVIKTAICVLCPFQ